jgi:hypothetical protein
MSKTEQKESILAIKVGAIDNSGNKIINVLATNNEYAIYEIEHVDVNSKLRVLIDGYTDSSEKLIQDRFNNVKQKYIEAKGLLSSSKNYGMMKQRIAHTLATCLNSDTVNGNKEFETLIETIIREHNTLVKNRGFYLAPCLFSVVIFFIICLYFASSYEPQNRQWSIFWQTFTSLLAATLGGGLSMLITAKSLNFEEFTSSTYYLALGVERLLLACMAGAIAFIVLKAGIIFPSGGNSNHWTFMSILVLSGFSESFIPGIMDKIKKEKA